MAGLFIKKDLAKLIADANDPLAGEAAHGAHGGGQLKRTLTAFNLIMLGIGAIIGAGIFSLTGTASANYAGPGIVYSFMIGGVLCALAGVCYAEMASMIPVAGSAYAYSYATMGEFIAWIIGWDLILEYAFGAVTVLAETGRGLFGRAQRPSPVETRVEITVVPPGSSDVLCLAVRAFDSNLLDTLCDQARSIAEAIVVVISPCEDE